MARVVQSAGPMRCRVTIQRPASSVARDNYGEPVESWVDVATVWASIEPLAGRELFAARQVQADVTHQVTTRHGSNLAGYESAWRIVYGGRVFEVDGVTRRGEVTNGWLDWLCREAAGADAGSIGSPVTADEAGDEILVGPGLDEIQWE